MKLIMLKGLPASGKSTFARELVKQGYKRVNKDDLRAMIDNSIWSKQNETEIVSVRNMLVDAWLHDGYNVVVDDTNFHPEHENVLRMYAEARKAEFEVKFIDTPVQECIDRDAKRTIGHVGKKVIMDMYLKYVKKEIPQIKPDYTLPDCYIFDIDGTLAKMEGRSPYDWSKVGTDSVNSGVANLADKLWDTKAEIILVSGRDSACREQTITWLEEKSILYSELYMRPAGDKRKDVEVKKEIYDNHIKGKYNVLAVFDDRNQIVEFWRSIGLTCLQVDEGDF